MKPRFNASPTKPKSALLRAAEHLDMANAPAVDVPACDFAQFLAEHARVRLRAGSYAPFSFEGRRPLIFIAELLHKIIRNCRHGETVEIDGLTYKPGKLKGSTVSVCGGAQFGKTVIELNFGGWITTLEFLNFGYYTSDRELLATIVDTKFRPDVIDQVPWMQQMIELDKAVSKSGRSVNRKNAFQCSDGTHKSFGYFNGMQKPPTTISLDVAVLDEVDDIPEKNIGFVAGRMTNSNVQLTCFIGTQRIHGAGQNSRWSAGTMHEWTVACPHCKREFCLEEHWPGICRVAIDGAARRSDPKLDETMTYDPDALYYCACPDCGAELNADAGRYVAQHPERARQLNWSIRVAQMDVPAIAWRDIVASWFSALADPNPEAMSAWHCDRRAIPHAGAQQPLVPDVLARARKCSLCEDPTDLSNWSDKPYSMSLGSAGFRRFAGMDTGPRCWLWINERRSAAVSPLVWAEMVPSGAAFQRLIELYGAGAFQCVFLDAGGEPDLTKRVVLALNGLEEYRPPVVPATELRGMTLSNIGAGVSWNGERARWSGIKAAAVLFSLRDAGGIQQDVGITQDGKIYPLIKCNRAESIQGLVNDFLTPKEGVLQHIASAAPASSVVQPSALRTLPRQRLPGACTGRGVTDSMLDVHLQNLRKIKSATTGIEDWADQVENHLGLAAVYARLCDTAGAQRASAPFAYRAVETRQRGLAAVRGEML